ncbi:MAG: hypothetical protein B7X58_16200 [Marinobacter sp. 34-60-7]|nr:MAG: hypothetical protein B7X58_16200 [Marinobacter sp. 34-60-7]
MAEDIAEYRLAGCNEHLAKPIDKQRFYEVLSRYLTLSPFAVNPGGRQYRGRVLVAEDNDDNRSLVERMLRRLGAEPVMVGSGEEAVRRCLAETVQLVLMDRHMPGMDGVDATRLLRQAGFRRPIIAFTAGDQAETDALLAAGCDGVLNKPIDHAHLQSLLERTLESDGAPVDTLENDIGHLVSRFVAGLDNRRRHMTMALTGQDAATVQQESHQIKGTAGAMGYPMMTEQAGRVEQIARRQPCDWPALAQELTSLNDMIDRALAGSGHSRDTTQEPAK